MDLDARLDAIDAQMLAPLVCQALKRDRTTIDDCAIAPLTHSVVNPVTAGLYQVSGAASDGEEQLPWSLILKIIHWVDLSGTPLAERYMNEPEDWNYWKREALIFQSGILDQVKCNSKCDLIPVRCYDVIEQPDGSVWLWLEHVQDPPGPTWSFGRRILAARHFGQFNGAYSGPGAVPDYPWLGRGFVRQWVRMARLFGVTETAGDPAFWGHPVARLVFPTPIAGRGIDLMEDADRLLANLERQPQALSHLDSHDVNLFSRRGDRGQQQTVVIDWSFVGMAAVGEDLGMQVSGNLYDCI
jgi:hypothetical protein